MAKRDVLDKTLAQRFAWRLGEPIELPEEAAEQNPPEDTASAEDQAERFRAMAQEREAIAKDAARIWAMTSASAQAEEVVRLFRRVSELGLYVVGMSDYPRESVTIWRLLVRHYRSQPARDRKKLAHAMSFLPIDPEQREVVDLLVEIAKAGDSWLALMMNLGDVATEAVGRKYRELGPRLAAVLEDEAATWASRKIAVSWLSLADPRDVTGPLRRALTLPHLRIRWLALESLLAMDPPGLTAADLQWLLDDAVKHPIPEPLTMSFFDAVHGYTEALIKAVDKVRSEESLRPLEILEKKGAVRISRRRASISGGWALCALAAAQPERARKRIDRALFGRLWERYDAVKATGLLPEELARPRLLEVAAGAQHASAELAKELWFKRFGEACPAGELAGVEVELLSAPPSERFLSRLTVLRGASNEARDAMLKVLLAEANQVPEPPGELSADERETLALILFSLDDLRLCRAGTPRGERAWSELLLRRFGEPAFVGLLKLAAREARAGVDHGWLSGLAGVAEKGQLSPSQRGRLRDLAYETVRSPDWEGSTAPLLVLTALGAPIDLVDRLWAPALWGATSDDGFGNAAFHAAYALVGMKDAPALDARLAEEGASALRARDYQAVAVIVHIGTKRGDACKERACELAERCIDAFDEDPAARNAAFACAHQLEQARGLSEEWLLHALRRPASPRFLIAARLSRKHVSPGVVAALEGALESTAFGGASAAEAAESLLVMGALKPEDARLDGILTRAPLRERASLTGALVDAEVPIARLRPHLMEVLLGPPDREIFWLLERFSGSTMEGLPELLKDVLAGGPVARIREEIEDCLDLPSEASVYFQDAGRGENEGDDNDDEDGDGDGDDENPPASA